MCTGVPIPGSKTIDYSGRQRLVILGSTGSIGTQALEVVRRFPERFEVVGLAAGRNAVLFRQQIDEFSPAYAMLDGKTVSSTHNITMEAMASLPQVNTVLVSTVGRTGLMPTIAAIHAGKRIALANKEVLIMAGSVLTRELKRSNAVLLPVDSEHSSLWQCLRGENRTEMERMIITASGGPFRTRQQQELENITPEMALRHPTWQMGSKITIDSATLMNKGFEVIETRWLFDVSYDKINVVLHKQSIIHAMIEYADGTVKAVMSTPDMQLPIQYALTYPQRWPNANAHRLDISALGELNFERMEPGRFPCFDLAMEAARKGGTYPAVLAAADHVSVDLFLSRQLRFTQIPQVVEEVLTAYDDSVKDPSLGEILEADSWAANAAHRIASHL